MWTTRVLAATLSACLFGCMGTPTPLAPRLRGSIGVPHMGSLTHAAPMPNKGPGFERLRRDDVRWGNPKLVSAIQTAAADVASLRPGAPLFVADLSHRFGGRADGHRSHRTGRDADILFYATTPSGRSVRAPGFLKYGADGLAENKGDHFRFDVERNWLFVRSFVKNGEADAQWIFVAHWIEALLIEYARARGEPDELVFRAENVLLQPGDSSPHADHFHVRVACSADESVEGCMGGGPRWPWLKPLPQLAPMTDDQLMEAIVGDLMPAKPPKPADPATVPASPPVPAPSP